MAIVLKISDGKTKLFCQSILGLHKYIRLKEPHIAVRYINWMGITKSMSLLPGIRQRRADRYDRAVNAAPKTSAYLKDSAQRGTIIWLDEEADAGRAQNQ